MLFFSNTFFLIFIDVQFMIIFAFMVALFDLFVLYILN